MYVRSWESEVLAGLRAEARHLAAALGRAAIPDGSGDGLAVWRYADPACERFGGDVSGDLLGAPLVASRSEEPLV